MTNLTDNLNGAILKWREEYVTNAINVIGSKEEIKAFVKDRGFPEAVATFKIVMTCYCPTLNSIIQIRCTPLIEAAIAKAIGQASGQKPKGGFIYNLTAMSGQFWGFQFAGQFVKVDKDGAEYSGKGDLYFEPVLRGGVITHGQRAEQWAQLDCFSKEMADYVQSIQDKVNDAYAKQKASAVQGYAPQYPATPTAPQQGWPATPPAAQAAPSTQQGWPSTPPPAQPQPAPQQGWPSTPPPAQQPYQQPPAQTVPFNVPQGPEQQAPPAPRVDDLPF